MACRSSFEEDLSCPVCCDIFINPVVLSCSHSICEECVRRFWENKGLKECPVCRRRLSKEQPPVNLALKNLCESYQKKLRSSSGGESVCGLHKEKLKLFCLDDQEPVCLVCRDSRKHTHHRFCPVDEAVMGNKVKLKDALEQLVEKRRIFESVKWWFNSDDEQYKSKAQDAEMWIKAEFEELHQFLRDEEAVRITALREDEKQRSQMMKEKIDETSRHISSLSCIIGDVEEQMKAEDVSFLQNFNATLQRTRCDLPIPESIPAVTIDFSNHLTNLKLTVLQKMKDNLGETSYFNIDPSHIQSDLAAMVISDHPEEYNENACFPRVGGNGTKICRVQKSDEDLQQFPRRVHPFRANFFSDPLSTTEPTYNQSTLNKRHPLPQVTQSQIMMTSYFGRTLQLQSRCRSGGISSPPDLPFRSRSPSTGATLGRILVKWPPSSGDL